MYWTQSTVRNVGIIYPKVLYCIPLVYLLQYSTVPTELYCLPLCCTLFDNQRTVVVQYIVIYRATVSSTALQIETKMNLGLV